MPRVMSASIKFNTLINLVGSVIPIFISLLTVPLYLSLIGNARYGVLALVWALLGYFGLFDLGRAVANQVAKLRADPIHEVEAVFWTAILVNAIFGVVGGGAILFIGNVLLGSVFKIPLELRSEVLSALPWIAISVPILTIASIVSGTLEGQERFLIQNVLSLTTTLLFQAVPLIVVFWSGPNLVGLIGSVVLVRLVCAMLGLLACVKYLPLTRWPHVDAKRIGPLCRYGGWLSIAGLVNPHLLRLDQFAIGAWANVQTLSHYVIPYMLVIQILMLPTSLARSLFPRFSMLQNQEGRGISREACLGLATILTPIIVVSIVLLKPFFELWIGSALAENTAPVGQVLLLGIWFNGLAVVPYTLLQGQGRADVTAKLNFLELMPYILMLWLGVSIAGVQGVAWVWTLRVIVDAFLLFKVAHFPWKHLYPLMFPAVLVLLASLSSFILFAQLAWRVFVGGGIVLLSLLWAWSAAPQDWKSLLRRMLGVWKGNRVVSTNSSTSWFR